MKKSRINAKIKDAIQLLELEQIEKGKKLKETYHLAFQIIEPVSISKNTPRKVSASPFIMDTVLNTSRGLLSSYISKNIVIGGSGSRIRKRSVAFFLQFGATSLIAKHIETIKRFGPFFFKALSIKRKTYRMHGVFKIISFTTNIERCIL